MKISYKVEIADNHHYYGEVIVPSYLYQKVLTGLEVLFDYFRLLGKEQ